MLNNKKTLLNYIASGGGGGSSAEAKAKNAGSYGGTDKGTVASVLDVESFIASYNIKKGKFGDLALGDTITINDGTYNTSWAIAEFDYHCDAAADFDKNYVNSFHNLALVPASGNLGISSQMYSTATCTEAYKGSLMNQTTLATVIAALKTVLGDHLKPFYQYVSNANVALGSSVTGYEWLLKEAFLMSEYQCFGDHETKYSIETLQAYEHRFPLMNVTSFGSSANFWLRSMAPSNSPNDRFCLSNYGDPYRYFLYFSGRVCPIIVLG